LYQSAPAGTSGNLTISCYPCKVRKTWAFMNECPTIISFM
jgi:hypothetical protein